jgi:hypothetical protein
MTHTIYTTASVTTNAAITIITKLQSLPVMMMMIMIMMMMIPEFVGIVFKSSVQHHNPHYTE